MGTMSEAEFERVCAEQRRALLAYLYALAGEYHLAEDLVQETMAIAHRKREHYFPEADFGAWLRAIARNVCMRERRDSARRRAGLAAVEDLADRLFTREQYAEDRWEPERKALRHCLGELGAADQGLIHGHFAAGRRYEELAASAGRTLSWVKVRMFRARKALADCIRRRLAPVENRP